MGLTEFQQKVVRKGGRTACLKVGNSEDDNEELKMPCHLRTVYVGKKIMKHNFRRYFLRRLTIREVEVEQ